MQLNFLNSLARAKALLHKFLLRRDSIEVGLTDSSKAVEGFKAFGDVNLISIGKSVSFGGNVVLYANAPISIGDHTMISINVVIHTSTHSYEHHPMWLERIDRPVNIGKHVWIGVNAIISPGVIVGDYAVIGAGSVVVSNVPERAIIGGNPARIIKYRTLDKEIFGNQVNDYPEGSFITKQSYIDETNICKPK